jgi:hypothetical protein
MMGIKMSLLLMVFFIGAVSFLHCLNSRPMQSGHPEKTQPVDPGAGRASFQAITADLFKLLKSTNRIGSCQRKMDSDRVPCFGGLLRPKQDCRQTIRWNA